jgi:xanthine dehydrogenase YagT iron-sulfur-binding subunit
MPAGAATTALPKADATPNIPVRFKANGEKRELSLDPRTTLLDALREHLHLHLTGTRKGCDHDQCGA